MDIFCGPWRRGGHVTLHVMDAAAAYNLSDGRQGWGELLEVTSDTICLLLTGSHCARVLKPTKLRPIKYLSAARVRSNPRDPACATHNDIFWVEIDTHRFLGVSVKNLELRSFVLYFSSFKGHKLYKYLIVKTEIYLHLFVYKWSIYLCTNM